MRRAINPLLLLVLLIFAGSVGLANAQIRLVKLNVPFPFTAVDQEFKPGMYEFSQPTPNVKLAIRGKVGKDGLVATVNLPSKNFMDPDLTWLIFHHCGDRYFLSEIWAHHLGVELPVGKDEKKLLESAGECENVRVNVK